VVAGAGQVLINIPASETDAYDWDRAEYDLYAIDGSNEAHRILQGKIRVSAKVK
jgi:hypothetical protein